VEALVAKGIPIYMCQNTMSGNNWVTADLIPGVQEAPAGVVAITDFGMRGWVVLTP
jgi:intracellular sulfur oxidation DsrE/DsrF family protein